MTLADFYRNFETEFGYLPDAEKRAALDVPADEGLFIVAGPGSGKTTVLTARILRLLFVDEIPPAGILATTFTKKAAAELRSRVLGWGFKLQRQMLTDSQLDVPTRERVARIDVNQVLTGTIDSICERLVRDYRAPGILPPLVADEFVSNTLFLREGLLTGGRYQDSALDALLLRLSARQSKFGWNLGAKTQTLQTIWDRRVHDQVAWPDWLAAALPAEAVAFRTLGETMNTYSAVKSSSN